MICNNLSQISSNKYINKNIYYEFVLQKKKCATHEVYNPPCPEKTQYKVLHKMQIIKLTVKLT